MVLRACAASLTALVAFGAAAAPPCEVEYWISPTGDDAGPGSAAQPFRTLVRARDAVRADPQRQVCRITVTLRGGTYRLGATLTLDARDSGAADREVVWRAAPGERPVVSGAVPVTGWALHDRARNIYRAHVGPHQSRQLYVNGVRATRAQTPSYPRDFERTDAGYRFVAPGKPAPVWSNPTGVEAVTNPQWKMMRCPVAAVVGPDILMRDPCWKNANVFRSPPGQPMLWNFRLLLRFENAYEFLDAPGEWYLDSATGWLYYLPRAGEVMASAAVELPVREALVDARGDLAAPIAHVRFEGLTFAYATWLRPSSPHGYAADQSGFHLVGDGFLPNVIGHEQNVSRTQGNVRLAYAANVEFRGNTFTHLGGAALDFDTGSQFNTVAGNTFDDISSAAIQMGGVLEQDHHPAFAQQVTRDNLITNNLVQHTGREYYDAAGIYIGFTTRTTVSHNDIQDVPWSGIAVGWGWGLLDEGAFPGLPNATQGMWGQWTTPSTSRGNRIVHNRIRNFLQELWDGGAIYTQGAQGTSFEDGELIAWNVVSHKRPAAGGNSFYTDGGSRFVTVRENVAYANRTGVTNFGPCGLPAALPWCAVGISTPWPGLADRCSSLSLCWLEIPYGADSGGCVPHGDLAFVGNYWSSNTFSTVCPLDLTGPLFYFDNHIVASPAGVPRWILQAAGRQGETGGH